MCISAVNLLPNRAHHFFGRKTTPFLERNAHFWTVSAPNLLLIRAHHVFGRKTTPFLERNIANPLILHQKPMVFIKTIGCHRFRLDPFCSRPRRVSVYHFLWLNDVVSLDRIIEPLNCVSHLWIAFAYLVKSEFCDLRHLWIWSATSEIKIFNTSRHSPDRSLWHVTQVSRPLPRARPHRCLCARVLRWFLVAPAFCCFNSAPH